MWFNLLKAELASQSGYAQLDFDNIVEEEDDNCKREWQRLAKKVEDFASKLTGDFEFDDELDIQPLILYKGYALGTLHSEYNPKIPEEVYCKALDLLRQKIVGQTKIQSFTINVVDDNYSEAVLIYTQYPQERNDALIGIFLEEFDVEDYGEQTHNLTKPAIEKVREDFKGVLK